MQKVGPFFPENLKNRFENKEFRSAYVADFARSSVAYQVRDIREAREWSQKDLAVKAETTQSAISRMENPEYGRFSVSTLLDLARAFDVALLIRFVPFRDLFETASDFSKSAMNVASFSELDLESPAVAVEPLHILPDQQIGGRRGQDQSLLEMMEDLTNERRQLRSRAPSILSSMGRPATDFWVAAEGNTQRRLGEIQLHQRPGH